MVDALCEIIGFIFPHKLSYVKLMKIDNEIRQFILQKKEHK
jgi:hypothetical protein